MTLMKFKKMSPWAASNGLISVAAEKDKSQRSKRKRVQSYTQCVWGEHRTQSLYAFKWLSCYINIQLNYDDLFGLSEMSNFFIFCLHTAWKRRILLAWSWWKSPFWADWYQTPRIWNMCICFFCTTNICININI